MNITIFQNPTLKNIAEKVLLGSPIDENDVMEILTTSDIMDLGLLSNHIKQKLWGKRIFYSVNMNLNFTNICELRCPLCAYSRDAFDENAFTLSLYQIEEQVSRAMEQGIDEVHMVGGLNPNVSPDYLIDTFKLIKKINPGIHIVALTAVEYDYLSKKYNIPLDELFHLFRGAGVDALPGGGAEIFSPEIRKLIAPLKISGHRWLEVMETAHRCGLKTNATMLYNHYEKAEDLADHMSNIRKLQEKTGGFKSFVPLPFHGDNTGLTIRRINTGFDDIRIFTAARIFLYNIPHIKALWMYLGEKTAQILLNFGADELGGTYSDEKIVHSAGAVTPDKGSEEYLRALIINSELVPEKTTALHYGISRGTE